MGESGALADRRNLLVIVVDCLRADRCPVGQDGGGLKLWPRLSSGAAVFTQMIATASNTPVCFASLLTGQYSFVHGLRSITGPKLATTVGTLQGRLGRAGYSTHAFLTGPLTDLYGLDRDFDEYEHREKDKSIHSAWGDQLMRRFAPGGFREPWFVLLHVWALHGPRRPNGDHVPRDRAGRYDLVWRQIDRRLAELVRHVPDNAVIVLTADHGEQLYRRSDRTLPGHVGRKLRENLRLRRRSNDWKNHGFHVFEELLRIPCCITGPVRPAVVDEPVRQIDIAPTLLELLGVAFDTPIAGRSLLPLTRGETMPVLPAYVESGRDDVLRHWHGLRHDGWKYAERPRWGENLDGEAMLFDLKHDPHERRNVIRKHPDVAIRMRQELDRIVHGSPPPDAGDSRMSESEKAELHKRLRDLGYVD